MNKIYNQLYTLSDGTKTRYYPMLFSKRQELIEKAKGIESNLKWTKNSKKLLPEQFQDFWQNDELVIEYRKIMKQIWEYTNDVYIVSVENCCDMCESTDIQHYTRRLKIDGKVFDSLWLHAYCKKCAEEQKIEDGKYYVWELVE